MAQSNGDGLLNGLDTISEYNIKFGRGHGDLRDACHLCGISPAMLKEAILADSKQHELELLDRLKPPTINDVFPNKPYDGTHTHSDMVAVVKYYEGLIEAERERLNS